MGHPPPRFVHANHRGDPVPAVLGMAFVGGVVVGSLAGFTTRGEGVPELPASALALGLLVAAGGAFDDLAKGGPVRGFRGHLSALRRGRVTTGILKLVLGLLAATTIAVAWWVGEGTLRVVAAVVLIAGSTNLWNVLDVRPGRALKWALVVLTPVFLLSLDRGVGPVVAASFGAAFGVLPADLLERGMLGDSGSNPLGFLTAVGLAVVLPTPGIAGAAVLVLALQIVAETVTISRVIEAVPPVRWFDRVGRRS
jgi:UDP-N-acetylmuramyl pentapeptide phosphotransferase/UDP-N-acetylglucosamine-1-phosphate transferase